MGTHTAKKAYASFDEFYREYFLAGHRHKNTKLCHFLAIGLALTFGVIFLATLKWPYLLTAIVLGYGLSIVSHYLFEKNHPATYDYPWYSFLSASRMFAETLMGKHKIL